MDNKLLSLSIFSSLLLVLLISHLIASEPDRIAQASLQRQGLEIEIGARLYSDNCRTCHGPRGEGVGQLGPALSDEHFFSGRLGEVGWLATLEEYIAATTVHGRMMGTRPIYAGNGSTAVMSPWHQDYGGPLRSDEIKALTAFILNWKPTAQGEIELVELELPRSSPQDPQVIAKGAELFTQKCGTCHIYRDLAEPEIGGPDLTTITTSNSSAWGGKALDEYLIESVLIPRAVVADEFISLSDEHPCGAILTESELTAVVALLMQ
jgi:mono/diheme cytochrome c family protein